MDNPFNYIDPPKEVQQQADINSLSKVSEFQVGDGSKTIKIDQQGLWVGAKEFSNAPYRQDVLGNQYWNDGSYDRMFIGNM